MIAVEIEHKPTGERRVWSDETPWEDHSEFFWSEGNFGCDCNRSLVWLWSVGEDEPEGDDGHSCGHEAFRIVCIKAADGTALYRE